MPRFPTFLLVLLCLPSLLHAEVGTRPQTERGVWPSLKRTWRATVDGAESAVNSANSAVKSASSSVVGVFSPKAPKAAPKLPIEVSIACEPFPIVLKTNPKVRVLVKALNTGKRSQLLEFASAQRANAVLRDGAGQIVARASYEVSRQSEPSLVTVNPGERLEYALDLPTGGLVAGKTYLLECALHGQAGLTARISLTPL